MTITVGCLLPSAPSGKKYSDNQAEHLAAEDRVLAEFDGWVSRFTRFVRNKDKVEAGRYRAYEYHAPGHRWADIKLNGVNCECVQVFRRADPPPRSNRS